MLTTVISTGSCTHDHDTT